MVLAYLGAGFGHASGPHFVDEQIGFKRSSGELPRILFTEGLGVYQLAGFGYASGHHFGDE